MGARRRRRLRGHGPRRGRAVGHARGDERERGSAPADGVSAWVRNIWRLVGLIMDYVIMRWDSIDEALKLVEADVDLGDQLPPAIESAVMLLRFEKIGRWESS